MQEVLEVCDFIFLIIYTVEFAFKIIGLSWAYFKSGFPLSLVTLVLDTPALGRLAKCSSGCWPGRITQL